MKYLCEWKELILILHIANKQGSSVKKFAFLLKIQQLQYCSKNSEYKKVRSLHL